MRINRDITAPEVRLIDENGEQAGVVPVKVALSMADEAGLDLVEVSPTATPPVCKILDYGKFKYQQQKRAQEAKKNQVNITIKEITIRARTEEHDYQIKLKKARQFIEKGDKVKFNLRFRGREITHKELGFEMLERIEKDMADVAKTDQKPKMDGRIMSLLISPQAGAKK